MYLFSVGVILFFIFLIGSLLFRLWMEGRVWIIFYVFMFMLGLFEEMDGCYYSWYYLDIVGCW